MRPLAHRSIAVPCVAVALVAALAAFSAHSAALLLEDNEPATARPGVNRSGTARTIATTRDTSGRRVARAGVARSAVASRPDGFPPSAMPNMADDDTGLDVQLSASFYADTSCLLTVDRRARIGRTLIDATLGNDGSRTLIHCDTEDGQRLTVLARGVNLGRYQRTPLLTRASIEDGTKGVIVWLTHAGTTFPDESAPRRYVTKGHVFVTETPQVQAAGAAPHTDQRAFARVEGVLETLMSHPGGAEASGH